MQGSRIPILFSISFLFIFTLPIYYLIFGSWLLSPHEMSITNAVGILTSVRTATLLSNTFIFAVGGATLATALATIYAWIVVRTNVPGKRILQLLPILPLTMPFIVKAFSWSLLFSPDLGLVNVLSKQYFDYSFFNIYSMEGLIFALGVGGIPLAYLAIKPAIEALNPALEEASRVCGNGILKTFLKVTVPILTPAILSAFMLLVIIGLENFDYPFMLGTKGGIRIETLATEIYFLVYGSLPPRLGTAAIYSIIFLMITISATLIYIYFTRKTYKFVVVTGKPAQKTLHMLGNWKYVALAVCVIIMLFAFALPFATLIFVSFLPYGAIRVDKIELSFTFDNYIKAINLPRFYSALYDTIILGLVTGLLGTLIAAFLSYAALKSKVKGARMIELINSIPLAFPGIVYGLSLFWFFLFFPGLSHLIYGTIWPLVLALIFVRLPYCVRIISGSLIQIADELEESSRVVGASWGRTFSRITLPLLKGGMLNSFIYTFINTLRELGAIVLLVTGEVTVLSILIMQLTSQHAEALNTVAAISVLLSVIIILTLISSSLAQILMSHWRSRKMKR